MGVTVTSTLDDGVRALGERLGNRLGEAFVREAQGNASRRTGRMAEMTIADPADVTGDTVTVTVHNDAQSDDGYYYGVAQDEGTGIFGPDGRPITPKRARVLAFDWAAAGGMVFAHSVRGSEPTRWWTKTIEAWRTLVRRVEIES